jgi:para-nitrobenzyl esterase
VRANIGAFGGDPAAVTLMGQSSGGTCVLALLAAPQVGGGMGDWRG